MPAKVIKQKRSKVSTVTSGDYGADLNEFKARIAALEKNLEYSQSEFNKTIECVPYAIRVINKDFTIRKINQAFAEMSGVDQSGAIGKECFYVFPGPFCHTKDCRLKRILDGEEKVQTEIDRHRNDGTIIPCIVTTVPLRMADRRLAGIIETFRDITESKRLKAEAKESEKRYRAMIELGTEAGEAIVMIQDIGGREGIQTYVSDQWVKITGYKKEELLGTCFFDLLSDKDRQVSIERHRQKMAGSAVPGMFEMSITSKNGTEVPVELTGAFTIYQGKRANVIYLRDISQRKKIALVLQQSEALYRSLFEATGTATSMIEDGLTVSRVNKEWEKLYGYSAEEANGLPWQKLVAPEDRELVQSHTNSRQSPRSYEIHGMDKDCKIKDVLLTVNDIPGTNNRIVSSLDITDRKRITKELNNLKINLEKQVVDRTNELNLVNHSLKEEILRRKVTEIRLKALYDKERQLLSEIRRQMRNRIEFNRILVHELKSPITPIVSASDYIASHVFESPIREFAMQINHGALRLSSRIDELIDITKGEIGQLKLRPGKMNVQALLQECCAYFQPLSLDKKISLLLVIPREVPCAFADNDRIRQVIYNLIDNAIKNTCAGGRVSVSCEEEDGKIRIDISDTGCGIPEKGRKYLFQPYRRARINKDNRLGGLGLGLSICKTLVELHGGKIYFDSQVGQGSTFSFTLNKYPRKTVRN